VNRAGVVVACVAASLCSCVAENPAPETIDEMLDDIVEEWGSPERCVEERDLIVIDVGNTFGICDEELLGCSYYWQDDDTVRRVISVDDGLYFNDGLELLVRHEAVHWLLVCSGMRDNGDPGHTLPLWVGYPAW